MKLFDHQHDATSRHFHEMKYWFVLKITEIILKKTYRFFGEDRMKHG